MTQERPFKHIAVTPADDEDVIIRAGLVEDRLEVDAGHGNAENAAPAEVVGQEAGTEPEKPRGGHALENDGAGLGGDGAPPSGQGSAVRVQKKRAAGEYRETTLADLKSSRMPIAQKIVIIAAVVLIIVAIVYYFAVMR